MASDPNSQLPIIEEVDDSDNQADTVSFCEEDFDSDDLESEDTEFTFLDDNSDDENGITYISLTEDEFPIEMECFCTPNCFEKVKLDR